MSTSRARSLPRGRCFLMKIVVVGSTGVIGAAVVRALVRTGQHEVVGVSRHTVPALDIESPVSIEEFFRSLSGFDALLCCAGAGVFKPLAQLTDDDIQRTLGSKLLGQVAL